MSLDAATSERPTLPTVRSRAAPHRLTIGIDASRAYVARPTGTEHYATEVVTRLVAAGGSEHVYRLYFRTPPAGLLAPGADIRVLRAARLWTHTRLAWEVAARPPDVLFVPAHVMPLVTRPPAVVTVHDLGFVAFPEAHPWSRRAYLAWTTRRHARLARHLIADSAATRDDLVRVYGADPDRITVVHLAADDDLAPATPEAVAEMRRRLGLPDGARYLLHVGTRQPRKNLSRLVEAFARVAAGRRDLVLVLAGGPGWGDDDLGALARRLGVADRLIQPGYVPRGELAALYTGAVACAVQSLYEGFGLTVLEAMACGSPVACSATSSLPEVAGEAALLFNPLDVDAMAGVLARLMDDAALRRRVADAGLRRAARFSWDRAARDVQAVLERAAGPRRPSGAAA